MGAAARNPDQPMHVSDERERKKADRVRTTADSPTATTGAGSPSRIDKTTSVKERGGLKTYFPYMAS
jgi:hypothetical protein